MNYHPLPDFLELAVTPRVTTTIAKMALKVKRIDKFTQSCRTEDSVRQTCSQTEQSASEFVHRSLFRFERDCKFFSGNMLLKCAVNPIPKTCDGCRCFEPEE